METGKGIVKNFTSLVTADFIVKTIGFAVTVYLARKLDPGDFGVLTFSFSIINYFTYFTDPGLCTYGIRKIAQEPEAVAAHMSDIFTIRLWLTAAAFALAAGLSFFIHQPPLVKFIILAYALSMMPQALNPTWIYQGLQKMELVGAYSIANSLIYSGLIFLFVDGHHQLALIPLFLTAAYFITSASFLWPLLKRYSFYFRKVRLRQAVEAVKTSLPIGVSTFLVAGVNWNLSTTLLGLLSDQAQVGYFAIAMKIALILIGAGVAFGITLLPIFSKYNYSSKPTAEKILFLSQKIISLIGIPLIFGTLATGDYLIRFIFGLKYLNTGPLLNLIIPGAILYILNTVYYAYLISEEKQMENMRISVARTLTLLSASMLLIPAFGARGAAAAYTLSEFLSAVIYVRTIKTSPNPAYDHLALLAKPLIASIAMFFIVYLVPQRLAFLKIPAGVISYTVIILAIKGVTQDEIRKLNGYFKKGRPSKDAANENT
ncbi:MAG TPA: hypothetical protein DCS63_00275 [Elusimicrobia bacterium]|nr:hypothetical protein [Elusimicrobiota bacterium]